MTSLCTSLPESLTPARVLPAADDRAADPSIECAVAEAHRPSFEANVSRAFQQLALKWLGDLFARYEKVTATCHNNRITVSPQSPQGFAVTLSTEGGRCKVLLGPCCEEFGSVAEATDYMTAAICGDLRLRVDLSERPHRWTVERRLPSGSWLDDTDAGIWPHSHRRPAGDAWYFRNHLDSEI